MDKRLTIQVVTWNSASVLPNLLRSLHHQTFEDFRLLIIDNASSDDSLRKVEESFPDAAVISNKQNLGFAGGNNQGFRILETPFVLVLNPDVVLDPDAVRRMMRLMEKNPRASSVCPKLLRSPDKPGIIDCAGLWALRRRQFLNRGEGEEDHHQFNTPEKVFGASGACAVFRTEALTAVRIADEVFDESFFAYKEDVDLAWRLLLAGWDAWYEPRALGYHRRTAKHDHVGSMLQHRKSKGALVNQLSYRNHLLLLLKNDRLQDMFLPTPVAFFIELVKPGYLLFFEPRTLLKGLSVFSNWKRVRRQRDIIQHHRKRSPKAIRAYFHPHLWTSPSSSLTTNHGDSSSSA